MEKDGTWADEVVIRGTARMLGRSIHIVTSKRRSSEAGYLKTEINVDGYNEEALLLGHIGELHYVSLDQVTVPITTANQPAMAPEVGLTTTSSVEESSCEQCQSLCCTKDEPNRPIRDDCLRKTSRCYIIKGKKKTRCVQAQWFKAYKWLTLCESKQKLFCFICRNQECKGSLTFSKNAEGAFITDGFDNWKKAITKFHSHQQSKCHREAVEKYCASNKCSVSSQLDLQLELNQSVRRMGLLKLLSSLRYLLRQGLAFRGHSDVDGNITQLLKLRSEDVNELDAFVNNKKYNSPDIQNELISLFSNDILHSMTADIKAAKWYSLIGDETCDVSNKEQLNISIRWVDSSFVAHEDPIGFVNVPDIAGQTLCDAIKDTLIRLNLPLSDCRGQAYDGAQNMQGKVKGVGTRIAADYPSALVVHCLAHCLNLCLQDIARSCKPVRDAMDLVFEIMQLIKFSPKRDNLFHNIKAEETPDAPGLRLLCPTRWTMRTRSLDSVLRNYNTLLLTLEKVSTTGYDEYARRAGGQHALMEKFSTFFGLRLSHLLFGASEQLSRTLQSKQTSAQDAFRAVGLANAFYSRQRSDEAFDYFYDKVVAEANSHEVEEPVLPRMRKVPTRLDDGAASHVYATPRDYFRHTYFEVIDKIMTQLHERFDQTSFKLVQQVEEMLISAANGKELEVPHDIARLYGNDLDIARLTVEMKMLPDLVRDVKEITSVFTLCDALAENRTNDVVKSMFSEVDKMLRIYLTIPVTSSTSERSFSALRQIKTYLRSTMTQKRLNGIMLSYIHKDRLDSIDLKRIAGDFIEGNETRKQYFGHF